MGLNWGGGGTGWVFNTTTGQNKPQLGTSHTSLRYYLFFLKHNFTTNLCALDFKSKWEKQKRLNSDNTAPRSAHLKNNYFTSIWHKSCNEESWKYPGWGEHIKNMEIVTFFPLLTETCKRSKGSEIRDGDQAKHFGFVSVSQTSEKKSQFISFQVRVEDKKLLRSPQKVAFFRKRARNNSKNLPNQRWRKKGPSKKLQLSEIRKTNLPFHFHRANLKSNWNDDISSSLERALTGKQKKFCHKLSQISEIKTKTTSWLQEKKKTSQTLKANPTVKKGGSTSGNLPKFSRDAPLKRLRWPGGEQQPSPHSKPKLLKSD